jgi:excinuclease ABC subunit C
VADDAKTARDAADLLAKKLESLPKAPGCYLFKDKSGAVVYVGKAKSLRSRAQSYFQESGSDSRYFIPLLRRIVHDLETIVTSTEKEAAVLENDLIKQNQPRFNVKLRDDKDFLCLRLDVTQTWPRLETVRRPRADGARYFGPYHSATSARRTLSLVNKHFQLRTCSDAELGSRRRPCLQFQIKRCPAPCVVAVDEAGYKDQVRNVAMFLDGRHDELTQDLMRRMNDASQAMEFELAAVYRDQLRAVDAVRESQRVVVIKDTDQDVIGLYREGSVVELVVLSVRSGHLTDTSSYSLRNIALPDEEVLAGFLTQHYGESGDGLSLVPDEILLPVLPDGAEGVGEWLGDLRGKKVLLLVPQRGPRVDLLRMAQENAAHAFREKQRSADGLESRLEELRDRLRLPVAPKRIECCDISHLGGGDTVGSVVSLLGGVPEKARYRTYHVKGASGGDDYLAMYEVLSRRFLRGKAAREASVGRVEADASVSDAKAIAWDLPDLFVVDGGRGQLGIALSAANDLGLHDISIVGLAKERESLAGEKLVDRVYLPGQKNGIPLRSASSALFFLARARDEAHRFANHARKKLGKARRLHSEIEDIPGLGVAVQKTLLREIGSMDALRAAPDERILAVSSVTRRHLAALRKVIPAPTTRPGSAESLATAPTRREPGEPREP